MQMMQVSGNFCSRPCHNSVLKQGMKWICLLLCLSLPLMGCERSPSVLGASSSTVLPPGSVGVDLSHHNGRIDWDQLEAAPIDFIYLKATEGGDWKDPRFLAHWREAKARGWLVGGYHFYRLCRPGEEQAQNFIQTVEVRQGTLPPAVDLEYAHNCEPYGSTEETLADLDQFLLSLEAEYGVRPVLYTTKEFHADWLAGRYDTYPLWLRALGDEIPETRDHRQADIWQYTMSARVPGMEGKVDMNRVPGVRAENK